MAVRAVFAWNRDTKSARPAVVAGGFLDAKRLSILVGDGENFEVELLRAFSCGVVAQREVADDLIRFGREPDCQLLNDIERSVGVDGEDRIKVADAIGAILCARDRSERESQPKQAFDFQSSYRCVVT